MTGAKAAPPTKPKPAKLGAEKLTPEEQRRRFEETARELGCDESEERFEAALKAIKRRVPGNQSLKENPQADK